MQSSLGYILRRLKETDIKDEDVLTAKGKYQYPKSFKEVLRKWR